MPSVIPGLRLLCKRAPTQPLSADPADPIWRDLVPIHLRENVSGQVPSQASLVYTAWDEVGWRILFDLGDQLPWATLAEHDAPLWTEEVVEVFVDPVGDLESYFEVEINPLGTTVDLVLRRTLSGWRKEFAWHVDGLESLTRRTTGGWAAELRLPFDAIGAPRPQPGTSWRANFLRIDRPQGAGTEAELSAWSPTGLRNFHRPEKFGTVEFAES